MNNKLKTLLNSLTQEQLITVVQELYDSDKHTRSIVEQAIAAYDPKELYNLTNKLLTSIKNGKRFIDYYASRDFAEQLDCINEGIEKLLPQDPKLALKLCQRFIEIDGRICERVDDSDGFLMDCYLTTYQLLDRAFIATESHSELVGVYLYEIYSKDEYGLRGYILEQRKQSLRAGADKVVKRLLEEDHSAKDYKCLAAFKTIADAQGDVDTYIQLVEEDYQRLNRTIADRAICDIAKRLNDAFRADEAINWLNQIDDDNHYYSKKIDLLMEAYKLEGQDKQALQLLWQRFERYLSMEDYFHYLRYCSQEEKTVAQDKALKLAKSHHSLSCTLQFLADIEQWDEVENIVIEQAKADMLDGTDYSVYRKLSTALSKQAKYLSATLLRRVLVSQVLDGGKSKYYHYALSDLKKAYDFSGQVRDWRGFDQHQIFFDQLKEKHFRKHSFWSDIEIGKHA
ncbi:hypothetical protein AB835_11740 [Candidatus Endobugula sertula]|uniref:Uncharacterized protein n=1 Tax=Candidatus Endobugula sertula TaxID=62101 RepID=A0A1D2QMX0_9GAMM|nr:hypothetical protein AB835_11740 [Candidatus Endobugula sertula]